MVYTRIVILLLSMIFMLVGCQTPRLYNQTDGNIAEAAEQTKAAFQKSDAAATTPPPLVVNQGLYVDKTPISLMRDPRWVKNKIIIRGDQLPFSYYSRTIVGSGTGKNILTHYQVGLDQTPLLSLSYSGSIKGALDLLAAKSGYVYTINGNHVYWQALVTKTFDIAFMPGTVDYMLGGGGGGSSGGSGGGGGSAAASGGGGGDSASSGFGGLGSSSSLKGTLSVWNDLRDTIKTLLSPAGSVIVSQSTTTVTVRDKPTNIALVAKYIQSLNSNLSRQVLVKIQVFEINLTSDFNYGIDWQVVKRGFMGSNFVLNGNYGTPVSITPAASTGGLSAYPIAAANPSGLPQIGILNSDPNHSTGVNILISALEQQGKVAVVSEPRVVCLNNQVSVISLVDKQGYAASVSSTSLAGGSGSGSSVTSAITPGNLVTGLMLYVLPKIMDNKVYLQVNADLSTFVELKRFDSGSGTTSPASIQTPHVTEKQINQRSVIGSGDTLILSGFRQVNNQTGAMQLYGQQALGGRAAKQGNTETVVLITPIILNGSV